MSLQALTLWRPWPDAFTNAAIPLELRKRCENRSWTPPESLLGFYVALHAGARYEIGDWAFPGGWEPPSKTDSPQGIVAVARLVGCLDLRPRRGELNPRRILQAVHVGNDAAAKERSIAEHKRLWSLDDDPWWSGPCGWLFDDVVSIEPVPCKGAMGLWRVPASIESIVWERFKAEER